MEDAKLAAYYAQLKSGAPSGGRGGLGAGKQQRIKTEESNHPLYRYFVRAGAWQPDDDLVGNDYAGNKLKFTEDGDVAAVGKAKGDEAAAAAGKKRKREVSSDDSEDSDAPKAKKAKKDKKAEPDVDVKAVIRDALGKAVKAAVASGKAGKKLEKKARVKVAALRASAVGDAGEDSKVAKKFDALLSKLVEKGNVVLVKKGKYAVHKKAAVAAKKTKKGSSSSDGSSSD